MYAGEKIAGFYSVLIIFFFFGMISFIISVQKSTSPFWLGPTSFDVVTLYHGFQTPGLRPNDN